MERQILKLCIPLLLLAAVCAGQTVTITATLSDAPAAPAASDRSGITLSYALSAELADPKPLTGARIPAGRDVWIFPTPGDDISEVRYWFNGNRSDPPTGTLTAAPFVLVGPIEMPAGSNNMQIEAERTIEGEAVMTYFSSTFFGIESQQQQDGVTRDGDTFTALCGGRQLVVQVPLPVPSPGLVTPIGPPDLACMLIPDAGGGTRVSCALDGEACFSGEEILVN